MFERYTEDARRLIFFARYEASSSGSSEIGSIHLMLGLLREQGEMIRRFLRPESSIEALRKDLAATQSVPVSSVSTSTDLPLSLPAKRVLAYASEESERLEHRYIGSIHMLLALMRDPATNAVLTAHGIARNAVFEYATATMPRESDLGVRFRLAELIRTMPPELLPEAEEAVRALLDRHHGRGPTDNMRE